MRLSRSGILLALLGSACCGLACQPLPAPLSLEAEYAAFSTQALTQSYLERKVHRWLNTSNGAALVREIEFARYKHPELLLQLMEDSNLCLQTMALTEVQAHQQNVPEFDTYLQSFSCAPAPEPLGELDVNTYTSGAQMHPAVAASATGDFILVWQSELQDGNAYGIYAQRYHANGTKVGDEFRVNTETLNTQTKPAIAINSQGDFLIVWASYLQDGSANGIFGQFFFADGTPNGSEFQVNTYTSNNQLDPAISVSHHDQWLVSWTSDAQDGSNYGVYAQRFLPNGTPVGNEFRINAHTNSYQYQSALTAAVDGGFWATWASRYQDGSDYGVYLRHIDAEGELGPEIPVNTYTSGEQSYPAIASNHDGHFVIAWQSQNQDGNNRGIFAQRFLANGTPQGNEFQVNTYTTGEQSYPGVGMSESGKIAISWNSNGQDGNGMGIFTQFYQADGTPLGVEQQVNTYTPQHQWYSVIAAGQQKFIYSWHGVSPDGSDHIFAKIYDENGNPL